MSLGAATAAAAGSSGVKGHGETALALGLCTTSVQHRGEARKVDHHRRRLRHHRRRRLRLRHRRLRRLHHFRRRRREGGSTFKSAAVSFSTNFSAFVLLKMTFFQFWTNRAGTCSGAQRIGNPNQTAPDCRCYGRLGKPVTDARRQTRLGRREATLEGGEGRRDGGRTGWPSGAGYKMAAVETGAGAS